MARKLKVFTWSDGFHSHTVAAPSRAKALEVWGLKRDIFKDGLASEIESGPSHDAALAAPGSVIQSAPPGESAARPASRQRASKRPRS
jgi:hypothetical protein